MKLGYELSSEMEHQEKRQIPIADQARDLIVEGSATLRARVAKFNCKWDNAASASDKNKIEEQINCNLADLYADQNLDQWAQEDELDDLLSSVAPEV